MPQGRILRSTASNFGLAALLLLPGAALATNGMNMIGYGAVSSSMGGADLAIVDNPSAMNINPAGICECATPELDLGVSLLMPSLNHEDALGNDVDGEGKVFPLPFLAYVHPLGRWSFGAGVFAQGGMGAEFKDLNTPFGTTDDTFSDVMYVKLTPTVAWRATSQLTLGASVNVGYAATSMDLFPNTSNAQAQFFGLELEDLWAVGYSVRLGAQYRLGPLTIGAAYLSKTDLEFDHGTVTLNFSDVDPALGKVEYDAELEGFTWPQQAGVGVSLRATPWLLFAFDVDWVNWSDAIEDITVKAKNPDKPVPPGFGLEEPAIPPFIMEWDDQWVWAFGVELTPIRDWSFRLGYNHGNSPVPDSTVNPLFPAIIEDHITAGVGYSLGPWTVDVGLEFGLEAEQKNENPNDPFGMIRSVETHSQITTHFMVRRVF